MRAIRLATCLLLIAGCANRAEFALGPIEQPGNTQIPLPPGEWKQLASTETATTRVMGGGIDNGHQVSAYYARIEDGHIAQLVFVRTSAGAPSAYGYGTGLNCLAATPSDYVYFVDDRGGTPNAIDCLKVTGNRAVRPPAEGAPRSTVRPMRELEHYSRANWLGKYSSTMLDPA